MAGSQGGAGEDEATQLFPGQDAVVVTRLAEPPGPEPQPATEVVPPRPATEIVPPQPTTEVVPPQPTTEVVPPQPTTEVVPQHPPTEVASPSPATQAAPAHPPTEVAASPGPAEQAAPAPEPTVTAPPGQAAGPGQQAVPPAPLPPTADAMPPAPVAGIVRYGPGVPVVLPVSQGGRTAEHVWRGGQPPAPPPRSARLRRLAGLALTVILLVASGVVLFLRFYHPPFSVTGAAITQHTLTGCRVDVTGQIATNGAAGTVTYRWLFKPGQQQATTLGQSVSSGQHAVDVTVAVEGSGQGVASQTATLQVLSPDQRTATTHVTLSC
jgi:hypothetical protein